jgi:hypothetical protein
MNTLLVRSLVLLAIPTVFIAPPAGAQQKLAQTGMKFLNVGTDPRSVAMGEAMTSVEGTSTALFFNPAGMARLGFWHMSVGQAHWIADIDHNFGSLAISPADGDYGVFGVFVQTVDYGDFEGTIFYPNENGYLDIGTFSPSAFVVGVGYARAFSDKFSLGGNVKFVSQDLGAAVVSMDTLGGRTTSGNSTNVPAFDFGILYKTGFKSLNFGMTVRNFAREVQYVDEGFQLPLTFKIGVSMNMFDIIDINREENSFLLSIDAEHPRDYHEQIRVGGEYVFMNQLALRAGYVAPTDEQGISLGIGMRQSVAGTTLGLDYAYTSFGVFDQVHRFSLQIGF